MQYRYGLLLALSCACAPAQIDAGDPAQQQAIINGEQCDETTEPTAVAILVDADINFGGQPFALTTVVCTGTVIAPDVVLTAAHCVDVSALTFGFGTVDRADFYVSFEADLSRYAESQEAQELPPSALPVREHVAHPEFRLDNFDSVAGPGDFKDVALLFLDVAVDVEPMLLITAAEASQIKPGAPVRIAGWGQQTVTSSPFEPPPSGTVGKKVCGATRLNEIGPMEMQVGGDNTTTRKCHGDSGGPTYLTVESSAARKDRVIGITSHAYDEEDCNKGGVDTRVDVWLAWIDQEMSLRCDNGTRVWCDVPGVIPPSFGGPGEGPDDDDDDVNPRKPPSCGGCGQSSSAHLLALLGLLFVARPRRFGVSRTGAA